MIKVYLVNFLNLSYTYIVHEEDLYEEAYETQIFIYCYFN